MISIDELLGELNNGFILGLSVYWGEDNTDSKNKSYPFTLKIAGSILEDVFKLTSMLHEDINHKELNSIRAYGFEINEQFHKKYKELAEIEVNSEIKIEDIDITDKNFVDKCIAELKSCIDFLNKKFDYTGITWRGYY